MAVLGVLGGMGPLVSAEFVRTLYLCQPGRREQEAPAVVLWSCPDAPDRNQALADGRPEMLDYLQAQLSRLLPLCDRAVICCFTAHAWLPQLGAELTRPLIDLVDLAHQELLRAQEPTLLVASPGSYAQGLFDRGPASSLIVKLSPEDQQECRGLIYDVLKPGRDPLLAWPAVQAWMRRYGTRRWLVGCTEFHLLTRALGPDSGALDPLLSLARRLPEYLGAQPEGDSRGASRS